MTLSYFVHLYIVHAVGGVNCWVCLTLDVHVSILYMQQRFTPLYFASQGGHSKVVDLLLERGAQFNKVQHCLPPVRRDILMSPLYYCNMEQWSTPRQGEAIVCPWSTWCGTEWCAQFRAWWDFCICAWSSQCMGH